MHRRLKHLFYVIACFCTALHILEGLDLLCKLLPLQDTQKSNEGSASTTTHSSTN